MGARDTRCGGRRRGAGSSQSQRTSTEPADDGHPAEPAPPVHGVTAADFYRQAQDVRGALEELFNAGRLAMSGDETNSQWRDLHRAIEAARASLDVAVQAMAWMETKP